MKGMIHCFLKSASSNLDWFQLKVSYRIGKDKENINI